MIRSVEKHGFVWKWDGQSLVEVDDTYNHIYAYTIENGSEEAFLKSVDDMAETVHEAAVKTYN